MKYLKKFNELYSDKLNIDDLNIIRSLFSEIVDEFELNEIEYVPGQSYDMDQVLNPYEYQLHLDKTWNCISIYGTIPKLGNDVKKVQFYWSRFINSLNSSGYEIWKDMPELGDKVEIDGDRIYFGTNLIYMRYLKRFEHVSSGYWMNEEDLKTIKSLFKLIVESEINLREKNHDSFMRSNEYKIELKLHKSSVYGYVYIECFFDLKENDISIKEVENSWETFISMIEKEGYELQNPNSKKLQIIDDYQTGRPSHIYFGGSLIYR